MSGYSTLEPLLVFNGLDPHVVYKPPPEPRTPPQALSLKSTKSTAHQVYSNFISSRYSL